MQFPQQVLFSMKPSPFTHRKLSIVLKCYVVLDMVNDVQTYFRENYIIPFLDTLITRVCIYTYTNDDYCYYYSFYPLISLG